jgi:carboxymethylenebutenolidase
MVVIRRRSSPAARAFYRHGRAPLIDLPSFVEASRLRDLFEHIAPLIRSLTPDLVERDAGAYLDWLAASPLTTDRPMGVTSYCMGVPLTLRTAAARPEQVAAVAGFHGGDLATDAPDSPHLVADRITAELYFGHADADHTLPPEQIDRLEKALTAAGVRHRSEVYEGAHHGFTAADTFAYNAAADERHTRELLALFEDAL